MLARRIFEFVDQKQFASVSGDFNPMHLDSVYARRTQAGAPVVHGIHLLLWALDELAASQPDLPQVLSIRVRFHQFVYLGEAVEIGTVQQKSDGLRMSILGKGALRAKIAIVSGEVAAGCSLPHIDGAEVLPALEAASDLDLEQISGRSGLLPFKMTDEDAARMFPAATKWLGAKKIAALAASTYLVGMVCPGLHSIYDGFSITCCEKLGAEDLLSYRVLETDERFRSVQMEIAGGGLEGLVTCFLRTPPVRQQAMQALSKTVNPDEFAGSVALVVGGSRGLGELTAKLIAAGGGRVIITWQSGREDAERVVQEIRSAGGNCEAFAYDARKAPEEQLAFLIDPPTHAYYFATPTIFRHKSDILVPGHLKEFLEIYVEGFWKLSQALRAIKPNISVFYPSSIFVTDRPEGMTEYAMAKAAGELLCADIDRFLAPLHVTMARLPRLSTDQTASIAPTQVADSLQIMLPIVREVQSWPS